MTESDSFIPIFVISLPDSTERRETITARLDALSLPFEFVDAIDGRNGIPEDCERLVDRLNGRNVVGPMIDAEFACALSHVKTCLTVIDRGLPYALILEDDAIPMPGLPEYLSGRHFENAEVTSLYYNTAWVRKRGAVRLFGEHRSFECLPGSRMTGMAGYIVSEAAAANIVANAMPVDRESDQFICYDEIRKRGDWRVVHPRLVEHPNITPDSGDSIINAFGRRERSLRKRRFLGVYVPSMNHIARSLFRGATAPFLGHRKLKSRGKKPKFKR